MSIFTVFGTMHTHRAQAVSSLLTVNMANKRNRKVCRCCGSNISWYASQFRLMNSWCRHVSVWCRAIFYRLLSYFWQTFPIPQLRHAVCMFRCNLPLGGRLEMEKLRFEFEGIAISILQITHSSQFTDSLQCVANCGKSFAFVLHLQTYIHTCICICRHISVAL